MFNQSKQHLAYNMLTSSAFTYIYLWFKLFLHMPSACRCFEGEEEAERDAATG